jgi:hypothetical protein
MKGQRGTALGTAEYAACNSVLKRDCTKTPYIVIPLAAGVLARCILATGPGSEGEDWMREIWPKWQASAREVLARCDPADDGLWMTDTDRYGVVSDFALSAWPAFLRWTPIMWLLRTISVPASAPPATRLSAVERCLRGAGDRSLVECMLVAAYGLSLSARASEPPLHARGAQRVRVLLADRLRNAGLTSWPRIVRAADDAWNVQTLERLAGEVCAACDAVLFEPPLLGLDDEALNDDGDAALEDDGGTHDHSSSADEAAPARQLAVQQRETNASDTRLRALQTENERLIDKVTRLQKERDHHVDRHAGAESRAEAIRVELVDARDRIRLLEAELATATRVREQLEESVEAEASLAPGTVLPPPNCFEGRRILLFTGHQAADVREAMRLKFFEFGAAQVDCYWVDKDRGPDSYPPGSIVVIDVTFMPHTVSDPIVSRARTSGVRCFPCRRNASLIAREVARRFLLPARRQ